MRTRALQPERAVWYRWSFRGESGIVQFWGAMAERIPDTMKVYNCQRYNCAPEDTFEEVEAVGRRRAAAHQPQTGYPAILR